MAMRASNGSQKVGLSGMGDVLDPALYQHIKTQGAAGPLAYPSLPGKVVGDTVEDRLDRIIQLLEELPSALSLEARTKFLLSPRETTPFTATNGLLPILAGPGTALAVAAFQMTERYTGALLRVGTRVIPAGSAGNIQWSLRVSGFDHPNLTLVTLEADTLDETFPFMFELTQTSLIELIAVNTVAAPANVAGVLQGWTEFMAIFKPYGADSASGIG
jgi:hypothetical protein